VVQRATLYAEGRGRPNRTGVALLVAIFAERQSHAARLLGEQDMTRQDAINFIIAARAMLGRSQQMLPADRGGTSRFNHAKDIAVSATPVPSP
jgi:ATP-dependent Clp protease ATP-binding subunit ClpA